MDDLRRHLTRIDDLRRASAILEWDQETYMPSGGNDARSRQVATLSGFAHELFTDDETARLLDAAEPTDAIDADLIRVAQTDLDRAVRIPASLVADLATATGHARHAWIAAREADDFEAFRPHLERIIELCGLKAEAVGYEDSLYDALLDEYEPGMKTETVRTVFADLRSELVPMVAEWSRAATEPDDAILRRHYSEKEQWDFGMSVMRDVGYDFERGRQDVSAHPFTTTFSTSDVRITTHLHEHNFSPGFFGSLHEMGHGLYEQGVDPALEGTLLADGTSLGIHESQSRLWENLVGRGIPFWEHYFPELVETFPDALRGVKREAFHRAINRVAPSLIRIEADEVTYNLHIMVRFELENELLAGTLAAKDLPEAWNDRIEAFLGVRPTSNADGCLQDIHWSIGILGYFPTYALGNLMSAQLWGAIRQDLPDLDDQIRRADFDALLGWLRTHVHRHGRRKSALDILQATTGGGLDAGPWLAYIREKFGALYAG